MHRLWGGVSRAASQVFVRGSRHFRRIPDVYLGLLQTNPLLTKALTSGAISFIGDLVSQSIATRNASQIDPYRTGKFTFLGFAFVGPCLHYWYYL